MPLSEWAEEKMPANARRIVATALDEIMPGIDLTPQKADHVRTRVASIISDIAEHGETGASGVVSLNYLAGAINDSTDKSGDPVIDEHLRGIAQSIACLTGQKPGMRYEPLALQAREEEEPTQLEQAMDLIAGLVQNAEGAINKLYRAIPNPTPASSLDLDHALKIIQRVKAMTAGFNPDRCPRLTDSDEYYITALRKRVGLEKSTKAKTENFQNLNVSR